MRDIMVGRIGETGHYPRESKAAERHWSIPSAGEVEQMRMWRFGISIPGHRRLSGQNLTARRSSSRAIDSGGLFQVYFQVSPDSDSSFCNLSVLEITKLLQLILILYHIPTQNNHTCVNR